MKPLREIIIREYLPGSYEAELDGRTYHCPSRAELWLFLRGELGQVSDPDDLYKIQELEQEIDRTDYEAFK
jgi:hypothetical protein